MQDTGIDDLSSDSASHRRTMVDCQIRTFDVTDQALLARMLEVPRERFLPAELAPLAYSDAALQVRPADPGDQPRTLLPPLVLARLLQGADLRADDKVLDVAPGTGYSTALLAGLSAAVVALESDPSFVETTRANLAGFGLDQVRVVHGPLDAGAPKEGPFNVILVNGAVEANLQLLLAQLKEGGRLVTIQRLASGPAEGASQAVRFERIDGSTGYRILFSAFAPVLDAFKMVDQFTFA
jgi:protein-L-isoaspartate(D-aspartate) O-methyltransferase